MCQSGSVFIAAPYYNFQATKVDVNYLFILWRICDHVSLKSKSAQVALHFFVPA